MSSNERMPVAGCERSGQEAQRLATISTRTQQKRRWPAHFRGWTCAAQENDALVSGGAAADKAVVGGRTVYKEWYSVLVASGPCGASGRLG